MERAAKLANERANEQVKALKQSHRETLASAAAATQLHEQAEKQRQGELVWSTLWM